MRYEKKKARKPRNTWDFYLNPLGSIIIDTPYCFVRDPKRGSLFDRGLLEKYGPDKVIL